MNSRPSQETAVSLSLERSGAPRNTPAIVITTDLANYRAWFSSTRYLHPL
ncbi:unnamed protein product [Brassica oleracea]